MNNLDTIISNVISQEICEPNNYEETIKNALFTNNSKTSNKGFNYKILYGILSSCALFLIGFVLFNNNIKPIFISQNNSNVENKDIDKAIIDNYENHIATTIINEIEINSTDTVSNTQVDNKEDSTMNIIDNPTNDSTKNNFDANSPLLTIAQISKNISKDRIFYTEQSANNYSFAYEPTIENLYENSDIVLIGSFNSNQKSYTAGVNIHTKTKFDTIKTLKNTTKINVTKNVIFDRVGGVMTLDKYMENNPTIRKDEFTDIPVNSRPNYYVIHEYAPNNKLDFSSSDTNNQYVLFLCYRDGELVLNSSYYGMRHIDSNNNIYNYDTDTYVSNILINE